MKGPGRPKQEETKVISFRVPKRLAATLIIAFKRLIKTYVH